MQAGDFVMNQVIYYVPKYRAALYRLRVAGISPTLKTVEVKSGDSNSTFIPQKKFVSKEFPLLYTNVDEAFAALKIIAEKEIETAEYSLKLKRDDLQRYENAVAAYREMGS